MTIQNAKISLQSQIPVPQTRYLTIAKKYKEFDFPFMTMAKIMNERSIFMNEHKWTP